MNTTHLDDAVTATVLECLSCTLNRGLWFTVTDLANATGIARADVVEALYLLSIAEPTPIEWRAGYVYEYRVAAS